MILLVWYGVYVSHSVDTSLSALSLSLSLPLQMTSFDVKLRPPLVTSFTLQSSTTRLITVPSTLSQMPTIPSQTPQLNLIRVTYSTVSATPLPTRPTASVTSTKNSRRCLPSFHSLLFTSPNRSFQTSLYSTTEIRTDLFDSKIFRIPFRDFPYLRARFLQRSFPTLSPILQPQAILT